jgi:hypothetical protein
MINLFNVRASDQKIKRDVETAYHKAFKFSRKEKHRKTMRTLKIEWEEEAAIKHKRTDYGLKWISLPQEKGAKVIFFRIGPLKGIHNVETVDYPDTGKPDKKIAACPGIIWAIPDFFSEVKTLLKLWIRRKLRRCQSKNSL